MGVARIFIQWANDLTDLTDLIDWIDFGKRPSRWIASKPITGTFRQTAGIPAFSGLYSRCLADSGFPILRSRAGGADRGLG